MQYTTNLNLKKPELISNVLIVDLNENADILDAEIGNIKSGSVPAGDSEKLNGQEATYYATASAVAAIDTTVNTHLADNVHHVYTYDIIIQAFEGATDLTTGDGKAYFTIPSKFNGMVLSTCHARVVTAGTTGTTDIQICNVTDNVDMLSTKITIDPGETGSDTAATPYVIDTAHDDVATNDLLRIDIDAVSSTKPKGLIIRLGFGW